MPEAKKVIVKAPKEVKKGKVKKVVNIPVSMTDIYTQGGYSPKAAQNIASYAEVCKVLPATYKEIQAKLPKHADFVGYLIRRGGIIAK